MGAPAARSIAIYYEHPDWFRPLFQELDRRAVPYVRLDATSHRFDTGDGRPSYSLVFNRMSPSAYLRGAGDPAFFTPHYPAPRGRHRGRGVHGHGPQLARAPHAARPAVPHSPGPT